MKDNTVSEFLNTLSNEVSAFISSVDEESIDKACELIF